MRTTPGIADPYWYEWYVGLDYIVEMLNPDNCIEAVIFQASEYETIDDVVVRYSSGNSELCFQVKHEIATSTDKNLTFNTLISSDNRKGVSLISTLAQGWKSAETADKKVTPILFTNRKFGSNKRKRTFNNNTYTAQPLETFLNSVKASLLQCDTQNNITQLSFSDINMQFQWEEFQSSFANPDIVFEFISALEIRENQLNLHEYEEKITQNIVSLFGCTDFLGEKLFEKLCAELRKWTTSERQSECITAEIVYSSLAASNKVDNNAHQLAYPEPFLPSRKCFAQDVIAEIENTNKKVIFISGEPGSGKTSLVSFLQNNHSLFTIRYHTFKPISPEQQFYNPDEGLCDHDIFWQTILSQLRSLFHGKLAKHQVPIHNDFCSIEEIRQHSVRLLALLGEEYLESKKTVYICIDGIDHAARANRELTLLASLFTPEELPNNVKLILVGQPTTLYSEKYPLWITDESLVLQIDMPKLEIADVEALIKKKGLFEHADSFAVAHAIYEKTQGNNLSTVFAVEEISNLKSGDDFLDYIQQSKITKNIQLYYRHIWDYTKNSLVQNNFNHPEVTIASAILLLNRNLSPKLLSKALDIGYSEADWTQVFQSLYPLLIPIEDTGEFSIFHNDFRIFLESIIQRNSAKYREISKKLALFVLEKEISDITYHQGISLLESAGEKSLIPKYLTPQFIIGSLNSQVSKNRLDYYIETAYQQACVARKEDELISLYCTIKTIRQHEAYIDYNQLAYQVADDYEYKNISNYEISKLELSTQSIQEFKSVLLYCIELYSIEHIEYRERAQKLYHRWFDDLSIALLSTCFPQIDETAPDRDLDDFLVLWGKCAAILKTSPPFDNSEYYHFNTSYLEHIIKTKSYELLDFLLQSKAKINIKKFSETLLDIFLDEKVEEFLNIFNSCASRKEITTNMLLANAILIISGHGDNTQNIEILQQQLEHFYDEIALEFTLSAFIFGFVNKLDDDSIICGRLNSLLSIKDSNIKIQEERTKFLRLVCLLGKYCTLPENSYSNLLVEHITWFLSRSLIRDFDFPKAIELVLIIITKANINKSLINNARIKETLIIYLLEVDWLWCERKIYILDYLKDNNIIEPIMLFIKELYIENYEKIVCKSDFFEIHKQFSPYGNLVLPELMEKITNEHQWRLVYYLDHKDYSLHGLYDWFKLLPLHDINSFIESGTKLYNTSCIANHADNRFHYDIQELLIEKALPIGVDAIWQNYLWDEKFILQSQLVNTLFYKLLSNAGTKDDFLVLWFGCLGLSSWYTREGQDNIRTFYIEATICATKYSLNFEKIVLEHTPSILDIIKNPITSDKPVYDDSNSITDNKDMQTYLDTLLVKSSLEDVCYELLLEKDASRQIKSFEILIELIEKKSGLSVESATILFASIRSFCEQNLLYFDSIPRLIEKINFYFTEDTFWSFVNLFSKDLSLYNYELTMKGLTILFKVFYKNNETQLKKVFNSEIEMHHAWITGNEHIDINLDFNVNNHNVPNSPSSICELIILTLIEQLKTRNTRRVQAVLPSIYKLGVLNPSLLEVLAKNWKQFSIFQKLPLYPIVARWSIEKVSNFNILKEALAETYTSSNNLEEVYYLHSILKLYEPYNKSYAEPALTAKSIEYEIPQIFPLASPKENYQFLNITMKGDSNNNEDLLHLLENNNITLDNQVNRNYFDRGDSSILFDIDYNSIIYGEEKKERWSSTSLHDKKSALIHCDDPFIVSEYPNKFIDFSKLVNSEATSLDEKSLVSLCDMQVRDEEEVLGACLWLDEATEKFVFYKIAHTTPYLDFLLTQGSSLGCYGLLYNEFSEFIELEKGNSLFNFSKGLFRSYHSNSELLPNKKCFNFLECTPSQNSPYLLYNSKGKKVLWFEKIASIVENTNHHAYVMQPVLLRWVVNKEWLEEKLSEKKLRLHYSSKKVSLNGYLGIPK